MLNLVDVLTCRRVMVYKGQEIEYTTGLCNEVYLNTEHCLNLVQNLNVNVCYMEDLVYLLRKHNILGNAISKYDDIIIINYNQKLLLLGQQYKLTTTERTKLANYVNSLRLTKQEKLDIYDKLEGFTVYKNGTVKW